MDDFSKQAINEKRYKNTRDVPVEEYSGDFNSNNYNVVANAAIKANEVQVRDSYSNKYKQDFDKASRDFWQKSAPSSLGKYNGGSLTANFGKQDYSLAELLARMGKFVKESISNELIEKKIPPEDIAENFKAVEVSLSLLAKSVENIDKDMDSRNIAAYLHGFINTYIDNMIKQKIERDKGSM
jgi:hypothetical protein|tara:strand:- start:1230 stop:1778 length:549 start_codon:yes stop_codon:yes gene_type:complete